VGVRMAMTFHEMQIKSHCHENSCRAKAHAKWF
jgi:hypothetical protein